MMLFYSILRAEKEATHERTYADYQHGRISDFCYRVNALCLACLQLKQKFTAHKSNTSRVQVKYMDSARRDCSVGRVFL